jgi:mitogen-activated protein kinase kinase kinase
MVLQDSRGGQDALQEVADLCQVSMKDRLNLMNGAEYSPPRKLTERFNNSAEYDLTSVDLELVLEALEDTDHFFVYTGSFEAHGTYIIASPTLRDQPDKIKELLYRSFQRKAEDTDARDKDGNLKKPELKGMINYSREELLLSNGEAIDRLPMPQTKASVNELVDDELDGDRVRINEPDNLDTASVRGTVNGEEKIKEPPAVYLLIFSPRQRFGWPGAILNLDLPYVDFQIHDNRIRLVADGPMQRLNAAKETFLDAFKDPPSGETFVNLDCLVQQQAHLPKLQKELRRIARSDLRLTETIVDSVSHVQKALKGFKSAMAQELLQNWFAFATEHGRKLGLSMEASAWSRFSRRLMRLAVNWVTFICDDCDPSDRKTFRWTVNALEYAMAMTAGTNVLHLDQTEFTLLRAKVGTCMQFLIGHFDILGARSGMEAKREAERIEALRRLQRMQENIDDEYGVSAQANSPSKDNPTDRITQLTEEVYGSAALDRSIRLVRDQRMTFLAALEEARKGKIDDQHLVGTVLDEQVSEDRSLLFLASSASNIALKWQQGSFIGGGANGNVYIGFNLDSGGIMAVKEIKVQDLSNSPALYKQIKDESDVMQMLSHTNIVDYYGIEVHRDRVYIFEEYCEGGSLADLLDHGRIEDEEVIMVYTLQMLHGLEYLHSKGVEHRDVKPDSK